MTDMKDVPAVACDYCGKEIHVQDTHLDQTGVEGAEVKFDEAYVMYAEQLRIRKKAGLSVNPARIRKLENLRKKADDFQKGLKDKYLAKVTALLNGEAVVKAE